MKIHRCRVEHCARPGRILPQLVVPCSRLALRQTEPLASIMGMPVCNEHYLKMTPMDFLKNDFIRDDIVKSFYEIAKSAPDFERAYLEPIPQGMNAFRDWERAQEESEKMRQVH